MQADRTKGQRSLDDLSVFATVARTRSFTRAAAELGMSNSMLSYTIKRLETQLGIVLLQRTSRSVAPTEAGEKLLRTLEPALSAIGDTLNELDQARDRVTGTLRITATRQAYEAVIRPILASFGAAHPDATVEVNIDYGLRDIVAERFDAGIRVGEKLQQDMVALQVGPPLRMAVVASPRYLANHPAPRKPEELRAHRCINYRMATTNSLYAWEFEKKGRELKVGVSGPLTFNEPDLMLQAAIDGLGIAYIWEHEAASHIAGGRLVRLLEDWTPAFPGFFLYYPSRKQVSPVLAAFIAILRHRRDNPQKRLTPSRR
jgi:DNA-binding transcriptional LysR family regulator